MNKYWVSWYSTPEMGEFELRTPWWISGQRCSDSAGTICAAIKANSEEEAKEIVINSYDVKPDTIEFRFCEMRDPSWSPFSDRFQIADWMKQYWED